MPVGTGLDRHNPMTMRQTINTHNSVINDTLSRSQVLLWNVTNMKWEPNRNYTLFVPLSDSQVAQLHELSRGQVPQLPQIHLTQRNLYHK